MVPRGNENVHTTTNFIDLGERSLKKSKGTSLSPCPKQNFKISGTEQLKVRLQKEEVSTEASKLIIKSRKSSPNSGNYCAEKKVDPFCSNINRLLEFLSQLFQNGLQYKTLNNYRSIADLHSQGTVIEFIKLNWEKIRTFQINI